MQKPAAVDKPFVLIDSSNGANGRQFDFAGAASIGPPDFFQALKPPWICATGLRPMRCAVCAASAERKPPAQKNTNFLSWANIGLWYGLCGSIQNSSIPRGQWKAPGTRPSRSSSRTSRTSTSTVSSRPASLTASSTGRVSISRSAASHKVLYPVVIACGIASLPGAPCWQSPARHSSGAVEAGFPCGQHSRKQRPETHDRPHTLPDLAVIVWFVAAWIVYSIVIERSAKGRTGLNDLMNSYRDEWMERLLERDMRMVDAQVTAALQNGAAFFASTSLIAIGGALTLLRSSEEIMTVMSLLPFGATPSRSLWDLKMMGLIVIFVYAFFKFAWSYRLFNYFAIMVGAAPPPDQKDTPAAGLSPTARRACAPTRAATSIAASAHSFLRLAIWAGLSARCLSLCPPPAS